MAERKETTGRGRPAPRLYLVTQALDAPDALSSALPPVLAHDIAAVLLHLRAPDERSKINYIKELAPIIQGAGAALLLAGEPALVARAGADGAHLIGIEALEASLETLRPERIAGVGGLTTRHDSMSAAEKGADYVMFGEPDEDGVLPGFDAVVERIAWWSELFEIPCVGYAVSLNHVAPLADAGADFVALGPDIWTGPGGAAGVEEAIRLMRAQEAV